MPATFRFPDRDVDLWFPIALDFKYAQSRREHLVHGHRPLEGRRHRRSGARQSRRGAGAARRAISRLRPRRSASTWCHSRHSTIGDVGRSLWLLFGGVIAGAAHHLHQHRRAAAVARRRIASRRSPCACRLARRERRVAVQLLVETLVLSMAGAGVGLAVASAAGHRRYEPRRRISRASTKSPSTGHVVALYTGHRAWS